MPAPLKVHLTQHEDQLLLKLTQASLVPSRTRNRAIALRLSARGWKVAQIAEYLNWHQKTVRETIHRWHRGGLALLWDEPRPGRRRRWQKEDLDCFRQLLGSQERSSQSENSPMAAEVSLPILSARILL